jgi:hypothetical protein
MKESSDAELRMDVAHLCREEVFTDRRIGSVRVLTPVTADGLADTTRKVLYLGEAQILTPGGALPLVFEIGANSLAEAVARFAPAAEDALERALKELEALRRQAASSIIVPPSGLLSGPGGSSPRRPPFGS